MSTKKTKKPRKKAEPYMALYLAVAKYVKSHGGSVAVTTGIQIIEWPGAGKGKFTVGISCIGRRPLCADKETQS